MVDSSRPLSRSGRSTRNNPHPADAPPEHKPPSANATASKAAQAAQANTTNNATEDSKGRVKHATRSQKIEPQAQNGVGKVKVVLKAENNVAGRKRTRGHTATEHHNLKNSSPKPEHVVAQRQGAGKSQAPNGVHAQYKSEKEVVVNSTQGAVLHKQNGAPTAPAPTTAPTASQNSQDKRTLRSQDGASRLKSELTIYFPNYDDIINDVPQEPEFLGLETPVLVVDEPVKSSNAATNTDLPLRNRSNDKISSKAGLTNHSRRVSVNGTTATASFAPSGPQLNGAQSVDLTSLSRKLSTASSSSAPQSDPLPHTLYFKAHRRAERKEKQLRNIEKERAQHEKVQLEGLLEGLQGPDWLKVMGITAITDGEKKEWEGKRSHFIQGIDELLEKFRLWKEEEKRIKAEKEEKRLAEKEEDEEEEEEEEEDRAAEAEEEQNEEDVASVGPNSSDLDASAARQLLLEARSAQKRPPKPKPAEIKKPPPDVPFTSFYSKPHLRAQALGKTRHGRSELAFGVAHPDYPEREFTLPQDYTDPTTLDAHARKRRKLKRERKEAAEERETADKGKERYSV